MGGKERLSTCSSHSYQKGLVVWTQNLSCAVGQGVSWPGFPGVGSPGNYPPFIPTERYILSSNGSTFQSIFGMQSGYKLGTACSSHERSFVPMHVILFKMHLKK